MESKAGGRETPEDDLRPFGMLFLPCFSQNFCFLACRFPAFSCEVPLPGFETYVIDEHINDDEGEYDSQDGVEEIDVVIHSNLDAVWMALRGSVDSVLYALRGACEPVYPVAAFEVEGAVYQDRDPCCCQSYLRNGLHVVRSPS
ncbi:MAG: hypothetical protein M3Z35_08190 [Nitrospirota bacterium]|nr:hypothetical protein [Nitrospirota bacterium]